MDSRCSVWNVRAVSAEIKVTRKAYQASHPCAVEASELAQPYYREGHRHRVLRILKPERSARLASGSGFDAAQCRVARAPSTLAFLGAWKEPVRAHGTEEVNPNTTSSLDWPSGEDKYRTPMRNVYTCMLPR